MASSFSDAADSLWRRDSHWIAPTLWHSEFRNVLARALRRDSVRIERAIEIIGVAETLLDPNQFIVSSAAVFRLVAQSRCSAYDCEFVALAEEQHVPLVTVDRQILRSFPRIAISLEKFIAISPNRPLTTRQLTTDHERLYKN